MEISAKLSNLRIAPRKVRLVVDMIRGKKVEEAESILRFTVKKGVLPVLKLLNQGVANAKNTFQAEKSDLFIQKITVDEGPKYKRWRPRSRGQAYEIQKKTSHITIVLGSARPLKKIAEVKEHKTEEKAEIFQEGKVAVRPKTERVKKGQKQTGADFRKTTIEKGFKRIFKRKAVQ